MKTHIFVTPVLSTLLLVLPGFAQQTSGEQPTSAVGQSSRTSQSADAITDPLPPPPTPQDFWDGDDPNLMHLVTHPMANKKYVRRRVGPIRNRINELDQLTSEHSTMIKDLDARDQKGIALVSEKTSRADEHATDAANKAQMAQTAATQATTRISTTEQILGSLDQYKGSAQTLIRFRPGQSVLSKNAQDALNEMAASLKDQRSYIIEIRGYAPGRGQAAIASSRKMVDSVVRYLVLDDQIPVYRVHAMSLGNTPMPGAGTTAERISGGRVKIDILKNDLVSSAMH